MGRLPAGGVMFVGGWGGGGIGSQRGGGGGERGDMVHVIRSETCINQSI